MRRSRRKINLKYPFVSNIIINQLSQLRSINVGQNLSLFHWKRTRKISHFMWMFLSKCLKLRGCLLLITAVDIQKHQMLVMRCVRIRILCSWRRWSSRGRTERKVKINGLIYFSPIKGIKLCPWRSWMILTSRIKHKKSIFSWNFSKDDHNDIYLLILT